VLGTATLGDTFIALAAAATLWIAVAAHPGTLRRRTVAAAAALART
jgi:hypothetical protein